MSEAEGATVMVVDDEAGLAELYSAFLGDMYDVRTATSGAEAIEKCDETVDVLLLDRRMPQMSGDEVLTEIRKRGVDCRVGMLSAVEPDQDIVEMPFDDYCVKPVDNEELHAYVETLFQRSTYDDRSQQFFSLAAKKSALEKAGNDRTEKYDELVEQMEDLRSEIGGVLDELSAEE